MTLELEHKAPIKLIDVLAGLLDKELIDEAVNIQLDAIGMSIEQDIDVLDVLYLPVDDFIKLYERPQRVTPPKIRGQWDRVIYGAAALGEEDP